MASRGAVNAAEALTEPLHQRSDGPFHHIHTRKGIDIKEEEEKGATSMSSVFTLCNSAIGAGVLSLPFAFRRAGGLPHRTTNLLSGTCHLLSSDSTLVVFGE
jgi:hypothetical protein